MFRIIAIAFIAVALAGCTRASVRDVLDANVITGSGKTPTMAQVRKAIVVAGAARNWAVKDVDEDTLLAIQRPAGKRFSAEVTIDYSPTTYSIIYKNSQGLRFDGESIHSRYNGWVTRLARQIDISLSEL